MSTHPDRKRPAIVIVGAGFGGLAAAKALARTPAEVTVIDRRNYHLFQPLLYQVATAALSPADIAWPIRAILSRQANAAVQMGKVVGVDCKRREVVLEDRRVGFDYLVLATGARHSYFGMDEWETAAPGLKKIADATHIRERVLLAFEQRRDHRRPGRAPAAADLRRRRRRADGRRDGRCRGRARRPGARRRLPRHQPHGRARGPGRGRATVLAQFPPDLSARPAPSSSGCGWRCAWACRSALRRRRGDRRRDERIAEPHRDLGRRRHRLAGREMAGCRARPRRPDHGDARAAGARLPGRVRDRRHDVDHGALTGSRARHRAGGQADGRLCRALDRRARPRPGPPAARSATAHQGNLATIGRKAAVADFGWITALRLPGLGALGRGACLVPDRLAQPVRRRLELDVELRHLRARRAPDHRSGRGRSAATRAVARGVIGRETDGRRLIRG